MSKLLPVVGDTLPAAAGIAVSPIAIALVILLLMSQRSRSTVPTFLAGWFAGLVGLTVVAIVTATEADAATSADTDDGIDIIRLAFGALFVVLAVHTWRHRPRGEDKKSEPKFLAAVDRATGWHAVVAGLAMSTFAAPTNIAMELSAGARIAQGGLGLAGVVVATAVFALIASLTILAPPAAAAALGPRVDAPLAELKNWLVVNRTVISLVLFVVFAVIFIGQGIGGF
jgi:hypothetical protein